MALVEIEQTVQSVQPGSRRVFAVDGATVYVRTPAGAQHPVYTSSTGTTLVTQPLLTQNGRIEGWVEEQLRLDLVVGNVAATDPQITGYTQRIVTGPKGVQGEQGPQGENAVVWRGVWSAATAYLIQDAVHHAGKAWIATAQSTGSEPGVGAGWSLMADRGPAGPEGPDISAITARMPTNPVVHGGVGDGVTDEWAAVQAALDSGDPVDLLGRVWLVGTGIKIPSGGELFNGTLKRQAGAAIVVLSNAEAVNLTGTNDQNINVHDVVVDGNSPSHDLGPAPEQGIGIEFYAVDGVNCQNVLVKDCPYSGIDLGAQASFRDNVGQVNAAGTPPARPPRPMSRFRFINVTTQNNGWQEHPLTTNGTTFTITTDTVVGQRTIEVKQFRLDNPESKLWPGLKVGIDNQGSSVFERATIESVNLTGAGTAADHKVGTVTFVAGLAFAHVGGNTRTIDAVKYWSDAGFGLCIREPAKDVSVIGYLSDKDMLGGFQCGQTGNIQYEPLAVEGLRVSNFRVTRCSDVAPVFTIQTTKDASVSNGFIGDEGGELLSAAAAAATTLTLRTGQGQRFYAGEKIWVGNPESATKEKVVIASIAGDVLTLTAGLANARSAGDQVYCSMSDGMFLRLTSHTPQQGFKITNVEARHCANGMTFSQNMDNYANERHSLVNAKSWQNRTDGLRIADASKIKVLAGDFHHNGVNGVRIQQTWTPALTAGIKFIGVECSNNPVDWVTIAGTYIAMGCTGLADTLKGAVNFRVLQTVTGQLVTDPGTVYVAIPNSARYQFRVDQTQRKFSEMRVVVRGIGNEATAGKGVRVMRNGVTQFCEATWDGSAETTATGAWTAINDATDVLFTLQVKGSSATEDVTLYLVDVQLR